MRGQSTLLRKRACLLSCVLSSTNPSLELLHDTLSFLMPLQTIQLVINTHFKLLSTFHAFLSGYSLCIVDPEDYISDSGLLMFDAGDDRHCHSVQIVNDYICERLEQFLSHLAYVSGTPVIVVDPDSAHVIIDDTYDCRKYLSSSLLTIITQYFSYQVECL